MFSEVAVVDASVADEDALRLPTLVMYEVRLLMVALALESDAPEARARLPRTDRFCVVEVPETASVFAVRPVEDAVIAPFATLNEEVAMRVPAIAWPSSVEEASCVDEVEVSVPKVDV